MRYSEDEAGMQSSSIFDGTVFGSQMMVHLERSMRRWSLWQNSEIPGRHCSWDEAGLNVLGAFLGAGAVLIVGALKARRKA